MKIYITIFAILAAILLVGCIKKKPVSSSNETQILAVFTDEKSLFIIDLDHEYEFSQTALIKFNFLKDFIAKNSQFIKRGDTLIAVDFDIDGKAKVFFHLTLDAKKLDAKLINDIKNEAKMYKFELQNSGDVFVTFNDETGKAIKLKNRDEIVKDFAISPPIRATKIVLDSKYDIKGEVSTKISEAISPIVFPFWVIGGIINEKLKR